MKLLGFFFLVASVISTAAASSPYAAPPNRSVSTSRQFYVYGTNAQLRGAISDTAEQVKANALVVLHQNDNWKTPIVINLQFPQANIPDVPTAALYFSQTGAGPKLQLDLVIDSDLRAPQIAREILRAILLERMYRSEPNVAVGTLYTQPPDWLVEGLLAASPGQNREPLVDAVSPLIAANKIASLEDFLRQRPDLLDAPARQLYQAYSLGLLQLLVDSGDGVPRFASYIESLRSAPNDQLTVLQLRFPGVSPAELNKTWQEKIRRLGATLNFELLTFAETERRLEEILGVQGRAGAPAKAASLEDIVRQKPSKTQKATWILASENLALLTATSNPLMRPVVGEYQQIAQLAAAGNRRGLSNRLERVNSTRTRLVARMSDVDDYMNWFEATQSQTQSDMFKDYLRAAADHDARSSRRRDAISVYLDSLEQQMGN